MAPALIHLWLSECPSAKEKPQVLLWYFAGTSTQRVAATVVGIATAKPPSLMLSGCSSIITQSRAGAGAVIEVSLVYTRNGGCGSHCPRPASLLLLSGPTAWLMAMLRTL